MNIQQNFEPSCDFDLKHNRVIKSSHQTIQLMMMCHQTKFSCKRIRSSEDISESYFDYMILHCDPDLEDSIPIFLKDNLWLMMMYHSNKFGSKQFRGSAGTVWTNIHRHFEVLL